MNILPKNIYKWSFPNFFPFINGISMAFSIIYNLGTPGHPSDPGGWSHRWRRADLGPSADVDPGFWKIGDPLSVTPIEI